MALPWYRVHTVVLNIRRYHAKHVSANNVCLVCRIRSVRSCFKPHTGWRKFVASLMTRLGITDSRVVGVSLAKLHQTQFFEF
jgi:hypothetical protein